MNRFSAPPSTVFEMELIKERRTYFLDLWQVPKLWKKVRGTLSVPPDLRSITGSEELWEVENG